jgi:hypothetical protein
VALAFATLPVTFAAFEMVSLLALRKDAADPTARGMDEVTPLNQSKRPLPVTGRLRRRRAPEVHTYMAMHFEYAIAL